MSPRPLVLTRWTALVAATMPVLLFVPALLSPSRLLFPTWSPYSDLALVHWPKVDLIRRTLAQQHELPLWAPYALSGQPLAANQLAMLFYPPSWLLLIGPVPWSFALFYAVHLAWAGLGTYWLVRLYGRRREAALVGALVFALNGKLAAHAVGGHASLVAAMAWLPWAFAFLHCALTRRRLAWALLAGVALAAQLSTHTYAVVYTAYGMLVYAVLYLLLTSRQGELLPAARGLIPRLALVPAAMLLLGAAQLLPLLEMMPYSNRSLTFEEATLFSLSPLQAATGILLPTPSVGHECIVYPGIVALLLAAGAWRARREPPVVILGLLALAGAILALGGYTPVYTLAYRLLPALSWLRTPGRLWLFIPLGLAVLATYGTETWAEAYKWPRVHRVRLLLVLCIAFAVVLSLGAIVILPVEGRTAWGLGVFGLLGGGLLLAALRRRAAPWLRSPIFFMLAAGLIAADLLTFNYGLFDLHPADEIVAEMGAAGDWLSADPGTFRIYSPSYTLPQPAAALAGLELVDGVEPVHLAEYDRFMALAGGYEQDAFSVSLPPFGNDVPMSEAHRDSEPNPTLLGLLNTRYLVSAFPVDTAGFTPRWQQGAAWIYENQRAQPHALVVHEVVPVTHEQAWDRLLDLDPATVALVEGGPALQTEDAQAAADVVEHTPNRVVVEATTSAPGFLLLSEVWYPGWQARCNGIEVTLYRADAILRGAYLEAGEHVVEFEYRPWTVRAGVAVSAAAALGLLVALLWQWRRAS